LFVLFVSFVSFVLFVYLLVYLFVYFPPATLLCNLATTSGGNFSSTK
jgi:hypothetical protein